jgi:hypothetical protein
MNDLSFIAECMHQSTRIRNQEAIKALRKIMDKEIQEVFKLNIQIYLKFRQSYSLRGIIQEISNFLKIFFK